jgi:two-component system sensor histidine kinase GlrK
MRVLRPRSLSSLLVAGLLLLTVPLAVAMVQAALQLGRLAQDTTRLVRQGVELAGQTQALSRHLAAYERSTNLYLLLEDPRVLEASRSIRQQIATTTEQLARLPLDREGLAHLEQLRSAVSDSLRSLETGEPADPGRAAMLADRLAAIDEAAREVADHANTLLEVRLQNLEERSAETRRNLLLWLAALVPVALVLGLIFTLGVMRPLRRVDRAITELGRGTFSRPIAISGPSDIEAVGKQLEWLRVRLLELAQEKNRFLRHMSHELKTPLANIREGTDLLLDGAVGAIEPEQREVTDIMRTNALRLQQLIENLLSYSAWQSSVAGLEVDVFPLEAELAASFRAQKLALASRGIRTRAEVEHIMVEADRAKIRLVLDNLLSNAVKFTPEGGTITVRARRLGAEVVIELADTGPGIPPEDRDRIFEAFYTGRMPQTGHLKGSGIGLSIVAEFVTAHGGRVELVQGEFRGAHFRVTIPIQAGEQVREAIRAYA